MTKPTQLILLVILAACGPDDTTAPTSQPGSGAPRFTVSGVVYDSLAVAAGVEDAVVGARVSVNGIPVVTDALGHFTAENVAPTLHGLVTIEGPAYELFETTIAIEEDMNIFLGVRRHAPLITGFFPAGDSTRFMVVDLQNRKTVERWQVTSALLHNANTEWTQRGIEWVWTPIDDITWLVSMQSTAAAEQIEFAIYDVTGFHSRAHCRVDAGCDHLAVSGQPDS